MQPHPINTNALVNYQQELKGLTREQRIEARKEFMNMLELDQELDEFPVEKEPEFATKPKHKSYSLKDWWDYNKGGRKNGSVTA